MGVLKWKWKSLGVLNLRQLKDGEDGSSNLPQEECRNSAYAIPNCPPRKHTHICIVTYCACACAIQHAWMDGWRWMDGWMGGQKIDDKRRDRNKARKEEKKGWGYVTKSTEYIYSLYYCLLYQPLILNINMIVLAIKITCTCAEA